MLWVGWRFFFFEGLELPVVSLSPTLRRIDKEFVIFSNLGFS